MLKDDLKTTLGSKNILKWLQYGAEMEDDPVCRAGNHFHNPYLYWTESGLSDTLWPVDLYCYATIEFPPSSIESNVTWATGYSNRDFIYSKSTVAEDNIWDWESARSYFYTYLTGLSPQTSQRIASDLTTHELYLTKCLRALGQVAHLVQDMAVPAHVRDDFSQGHTRYLKNHEETWDIRKWFGNPFEDHVRFYQRSSWFDADPIAGAFTSFMLTDLWDTNQLQPDTTPEQLEQINTASLGLSEYTSSNFLSLFTMFNTNDSGNLVYPYPKPEHCAVVLENPPDVLTTLERQYLSTTNGHPGDPVDKLAVVGYLKYYRDVYFPNVSSEMLPIGLDSNCYDDYARKLIPRAIGYSAQLIDYFFRGRMQVWAFPYFVDNSLYSVKLNITNTTATQEAMQDGTLTLTFRYTPAGGNADGSDDIFVPADEFISLTELLYNDSVDVLFYPSENIPIESWESVTCTLAFLGTLGNEPGVVAGQVFTPGELLFNEEWDNGLTGNYSWESTPDTQNWDNGLSVTEIVDGRLVLENFRYADDDRARVNELWVDFTSDGSEGILISSSTYIQFIINEMSTTSTDTANGHHIMLLTFNDGLRLQVSDQGPYLIYWWPSEALNDTTARLSFTPQYIISNNIYAIFQSLGIQIPDQLYLKKLDFVQQIYNDSPGEYHMRMEVDAIRLIETQPLETP